MIVSLALLLLVGQTTAGSSTDQNDIIVTGQSLGETERAWKSCRDRQCPPDEEIRAALAHGENLFVAGDYVRAQAVLYRTIDNTRGAAARYPVQVADLRRAEARIEAHLGEIEPVRTGAIASLDALKTGLPKSDPRVLGQAMEIGDAFLHQGKYLDAVQQYNDVANRARKANVPAIEGYSLLRVAAFWTQQAQQDPGIYSDEARRTIARVLKLEGPAYEQFRRIATVLAARLQGAKGDKTALNQLIATTPAENTTHPTLLYQPLIVFKEGRTISSVPFSPAESKDNLHSFEWIDVGYRINSDGTVSDATLLRDSGKINDSWVKPVLTSIAGRRYAPITRSDGAYRVERYSRVVLADQTTGSYFSDGTGEQRLLVMDLTR